MSDWFKNAGAARETETNRPSGGPRKTNPNRYLEKAFTNECRRVTDSGEGERNTNLNKAAFALGQLVGGDALDEQEVFAALFAAGRQVGLSKKETEDTISSGLKAGKTEPRTVPPPSNDTEETEPNAAPANDAEPSTYKWPAIVPIDDAGQLPPFPVEALPVALRKWVKATSVATQTPPELAACLGLAAIGAAVAKRYDVQVRPGYRECLATWWTIILPPAERKSAVYKAAMQAFRDYEREQAEKMSAQISAAVTRRTVLEKRYAKAMETAAKKDEAELLQEAEQIGVQLAEMAIPVVPRLTCADVTSEKLVQLMHDHGGRMALMSPEGGCFDTMSGRYSNGTPNIDIFLQGHMGEPYQVDRIGRPPLRIERSVLTMALCVQPGVIESLAKMPGFRDRGLLGRLCYVMPTSWIGSRDVAPPPVPEDIAAGYNGLIGKLLALPETRDAAGEIVSTTLALSPGALAVRDRFAAALEPRLGPGGDLEHIRDWAGKLPGLMVRIACLIHLGGGFECSEGFEVGSVSECEGNESEKICLFLLKHTLATFRMMGADPALGKARVLLNWIAKHDLETFTRRDAHQGNRATFVQPDDVDDPLCVLAAHGYIREKSRVTGPKGGRPSVVYTVNPALKTLKTSKPHTAKEH